MLGNTSPQEVFGIQTPALSYQLISSIFNPNTGPVTSRMATPLAAFQIFFPLYGNKHTVC